MSGEDLHKFCAPGSSVREEEVIINPQVTLRLLVFTPARESGNPAVVFIPGWISLIDGWGEVLREMTRDFTIYYLETREKTTARVRGKADYSVAVIAGDIHNYIKNQLPSGGAYLLFASSLGATAVLDCAAGLDPEPRCLVLVAPNAVFRVPRFWKMVIMLFYPPLYSLIKPAVKWYLRTFRMNVEADRAQYDKYCRALDGADAYKLKKAATSLWSYSVWDKLADITSPVLIIGASQDKLHEPENLKKMCQMLPKATYLDLETNSGTHSRGMVQQMRQYLKKIEGISR